MDLLIITKFYSVKYFLQYFNNSTTSKLINYYSNFLTVVYIVHNGKTGDDIEARSFKLSKLKDFIEKPSNTPVVTGNL